jgi:putative hydrolase of the HAD superfamily
VTERRSAAGTVPRARDCVLFDGDNTLWLIERLYDEARERLCDTIENLGAVRAEVEAFQRSRDAELYTKYGYSQARFPQSFVDTLLRFVPSADAAMIQACEQLGRAVFEATPPVREEVDAVLERLSASHRLVLFTAGDEEIQQARVHAFGRGHHFDCIKIVPRKSAEAFRSLISELGLDVSQTWMVGDSLISDILPAVEAGLRAIYLSADNWTPIERREARVPLGVPTVHNLTEIFAFISNVRG